MPKGSARVCSTARVWGNTARSTRKRPAPVRLQTALAMAMASAAAVASSNKEALAIGRPVSSLIRV